MTNLESLQLFTSQEQAQLHGFAAAGAARYTAQKLQIPKIAAGVLPFADGDSELDPHGLTDYNKTFYPGEADPSIISTANRVLKLMTGFSDIDRYAVGMQDNLGAIEHQLQEAPVVLAVGHAGFFEGPLALETIKRARALYHTQPLLTSQEDPYFDAYFAANRAAHGVATRAFIPVTLGVPISPAIGKKLHLPTAFTRQSFVANVFLRAGTSHYSIPATDRAKDTARKLDIDPTLIKRYNARFKTNWEQQAAALSSFGTYNTFTVAASGTNDRKDKKSGDTLIQPVRGRTGELATSIGAAIIPVFISLSKNNKNKNIIQLGEIIAPENVTPDTLHEIELQRAAFRVACGEKAIRYTAPR